MFTRRFFRHHWACSAGKLLKDTRGQSLTEFAITLPTLIIMFWGIFYVSNMFLIKHKTLVASRYASWHAARGNMSVVNSSHIGDLFFDDIAFDDYSSGKVTVTAVSADGNILDEVLDFVSAVFSSQTSSYTVSYKVPASFPPAKGGSRSVIQLTNDNSIYLASHSQFDISSTHHVVGNAWDGCHTNVHELLTLMFNTFTTAIGKIGDLFTNVFESVLDFDMNSLLEALIPDEISWILDLVD